MTLSGFPRNLVPQLGPPLRDWFTSELFGFEDHSLQRKPSRRETHEGGRKGFRGAKDASVLQGGSK